MNEEIKKYVQELIKARTEKKEETTETPETENNGGTTQEIDVDSLFKSEFRIGSTLEQTSWGNVISNVREHNADRDLAKAYAASPRQIKKK